MPPLDRTETPSPPVEPKDHHICRFFCYHCEVMSVTQTQMEEHLKEKHECNRTAVQPVNPCKYDLLKDLFVVCPPNTDVQLFQKCLVSRANKLSCKVKFFPTEIEKLPKNQIFGKELESALCGFRNKVRLNLILRDCTRERESIISQTQIYSQELIHSISLKRNEVPIT